MWESSKQGMFFDVVEGFRVDGGEEIEGASQGASKGEKGCDDGEEGEWCEERGGKVGMEEDKGGEPGVRDENGKGGGKVVGSKRAHVGGKAA